MRKLASATTLLAVATVPMLVLAMPFRASAISPVSASGVGAARNTAAPRSTGLSPMSAAPHRASIILPIVTPPSVAIPPIATATATATPRSVVNPPIATPVSILQGPTSVAPGLYPLQASASAVTVSWYDRSNTPNIEQGFQVFKRDLSGNWQMVYQVPTSGGTNY